MKESKVKVEKQISNKNQSLDEGKLLEEIKDLKEQIEQLKNSNNINEKHVLFKNKKYEIHSVDSMKETFEMFKKRFIDENATVVVLGKEV